MKREVKSLRIDPEIWRRAKAQAALDGKTLGEFIEKTLMERLEGEEE